MRVEGKEENGEAMGDRRTCGGVEGKHHRHSVRHTAFSMDAVSTEGIEGCPVPGQ